MRRIFTLLLLFGFASAGARPLDITVDAEGAILVNAKTGAALYEKDADRQFYPASIFKIITALITLENQGDALDHSVQPEMESLTQVDPREKRRSDYSLPPYWLESDAKLTGIKREERLPLRDLLYAMMMTSSGDASNVIAQHIGGTVTQFCEQANARVMELGCKATHVMNPHGLHHPNQKTTARDMALITRTAMEIPQFREIVSTVTRPFPAGGGRKGTTLRQTNKLMRSGSLHYPPAIGVKTGWHSNAKHTLVAAAEKGGRSLIAVLLKTSNRDKMFADAAVMFDKAFSERRMHKRLLAKGKQNFSLALPGGDKAVTGWLHDDVVLVTYLSEERPLKAVMDWDSLRLPIERGDRVGQVEVRADDGEITLIAPVFALEAVNPTLWHTIKESLFGSTGVSVALLALISVAFIGLYRRP